jgi:hypothetical protein
MHTRASAQCTAAHSTTSLPSVTNRWALPTFDFRTIILFYVFSRGRTAHIVWHYVLGLCILFSLRTIGVRTGSGLTVHHTVSYRAPSFWTTNTVLMVWGYVFNDRWKRDRTIMIIIGFSFSVESMRSEQVFHKSYTFKYRYSLHTHTHI